MNLMNKVRNLLKFKNVLLKFGGSSYWANVAKLSGSTLVSQLLGFVLGIVVARMYIPSMSGLYAICAACVGVIAPISAFRYEFAIGIPIQEREAVAVFNASLLLLACTTCFCFFIAFLHWLGCFGGIYKELNLYVFCIPLLIFVSGLGNCYTYWCNRLSEFGMISKNRILLTLCHWSTLILYAYIVGPSPTAFFVVGLVAPVLGLFILIRALRAKKSMPCVSFAIAIGAGRQQIAKFKSFAIYNTPMSMFDQLAAMSPALFIGNYMGSEVIGHYNHAVNILRAPSILLGGAIAQVFFSKAISLKSDIFQLRKLFVRNVAFMSIIGIFMGLVMSFLGKDIFALIYGDQWLLAGDLSGVLAWSSAVFLVASPVGLIPSLFNVQNTQLRFVVIGAILKMLLLWYFCATGKLFTALYCALIVDALTYTTCLLWIWCYILRFNGSVTKHCNSTK